MMRLIKRLQNQTGKKSYERVFSVKKADYKSRKNTVIAMGTIILGVVISICFLLGERSPVEKRDDISIAKNSKSFDDSSFDLQKADPYDYTQSSGIYSENLDIRNNDYDESFEDNKESMDSLETTTNATEKNHTSTNEVVNTVIEKTVKKESGELVDYQEVLYFLNAFGGVVNTDDITTLSDDDIIKLCAMCSYKNQNYENICYAIRYDSSKKAYTDKNFESVLAIDKDTLKEYAKQFFGRDLGDMKNKSTNIDDTGNLYIVDSDKIENYKHFYYNYLIPKSSFNLVTEKLLSKDDCYYYLLSEDEKIDSSISIIDTVYDGEDVNVIYSISNKYYTGENQNASYPMMKKADTENYCMMTFTRKSDEYYDLKIKADRSIKISDYHSYVKNRGYETGSIFEDFPTNTKITMKDDDLAKNRYVLLDKNKIEAHIVFAKTDISGNVIGADEAVLTFDIRNAKRLFENGYCYKFTEYECSSKNIMEKITDPVVITFESTSNSNDFDINFSNSICEITVGTKDYTYTYHYDNER